MTWGHLTAMPMVVPVKCKQNLLNLGTEDHVHDVLQTDPCFPLSGINVVGQHKNQDMSHSINGCCNGC